MASSLNIPEGVYNKEIVGNNIYLHLKHPKMLKSDRIKIAMAHQPPELDLTRPWTPADEVSSGFTYLNDQQHVYMRCKVGDEVIDHTHMRYISPAQNKASGHLPDLVEIQKYLLEPSWKEDALAAQDNPKQYKKDRGSTFDLTFSTEPGNKDSCIHVAKLAQNDTEEHKDCVQRLIKVMTAILDEHLSAETSLEHRKIRWAMNASITAGNEDNRWLSHIQINVTELDQGLKVSLKRAGRAHFDRNDMPTSWSVILFLSHFPDDYHPGIMAIYSTRVCCPCETYGAAVLTGTHPHSGAGKGFLPEGYVKPSKPSTESDTDYPKLPAHLPYTRLHAVGYPRNNNIQARSNEINIELYHLNALGAFGTAQNWVEFKLRTYIKHCIDVIREDPQYWCDKFEYRDENGVTYKPRLWVAQMCFDYAKYAWLDHPEHKKLHKALLAAGVGSTLPRDENAPTKPKRPKRKPRPRGEPITKVQCDGLTAAGKRCTVTFQPKPNGNTRCARHTEKTSSDDVSKTEQDGVVADGNPYNLKRSFDEMDILDQVAALGEEYEGGWDEGDGSVYGRFDGYDGYEGFDAGHEDTSPAYYAGLEYRGYGDLPSDYAQPDGSGVNGEENAPEGYQEEVGEVDTSGLYDAD
ncbi:hypothetical protein L207DRAFT_533870 [Hyaloscypha variabilis F]|uniref:Uncharacterized protein n=1 Tax=Hyaloscypha variabilis (strain UAMH 11265 / GT02V1 / F) TaxID=1149755 RepID=A0A2J6R7P9_HYAVF|nr:hypothetical protein L207DRAFT_533870 [Hyaloscypha variabilis F]